MRLTSGEQDEVDHLIRTLRQVARDPEKMDPLIVGWATDQAAIILRNLFPINYTTPPPPHEGMVSLFVESGSHGEG